MPQPRKRKGQAEYCVIGRPVIFYLTKWGKEYLRKAWEEVGQTQREMCGEATDLYLVKHGYAPLNIRSKRNVEEISDEATA
jgi:hypothetical protein